jgi:hypothetical protein
MLLQCITLTYLQSAFTELWCYNTLWIHCYGCT